MDDIRPQSAFHSGCICEQPGPAGVQGDVPRRPDGSLVMAIHVFERAGLGKAPFRIVGVEYRVGPIKIGEHNGVEIWAGSPGQPMGSCKFCGQGIAECWIIESSDGNRFDVGCDCVRKTGDVGLKKAMAPHLREKRQARDDAKIEAGKAWFDEQCAAGFDFGERTRGCFAEYFEWMMRNAGRSGKLRAIREARNIRGVS